MGVVSVGSSLPNVGRSGRVNALNQSLDYKNKKEEDGET